MTSARRKARQTYHGLSGGKRLRGSVYTGLPGVPLYFTKGEPGPTLSRKQQPAGPRRKRMLVPHQSKKGVWSLHWARVEVLEGA